MNRISSNYFFMSKTRRERCPKCSTLNVIRWVLSIPGHSRGIPKTISVAAVRCSRSPLTMTPATASLIPIYETIRICYVC